MSYIYSKNQARSSAEVMDHELVGEFKSEGLAQLLLKMETKLREK